MTFGRVPDRHRRLLGRGRRPTAIVNSAVPVRPYRSAREVVGRGFPEPSRQTLMRLHRVERIAPPKPFGAALCGSSTAGASNPVGPDGFACLAGAGARPGYGPRVEALSVHRQLVEAGFQLGTDDGDD